MLKRRAVLAPVLALSAAAVVACSAGSTATQVGRISDSGVVVAATTAPATLDFTSTGGAAIPQALMGNVYETLVRVDDDGHVIPGLATSWETSADGLTYLFHLREDVTFSNGAAFTAESAVFSIAHVQDSWTNGLKAQMDVVSGARAVDTHLLEVTLTRPSHRWLWSMATLTGAMMTPTGVADLATDPVGTGPYEVERFVPGESVSFSARPDYWGQPAAEEEAAIRYYTDATSSVNALLTGDVDLVYGMQAPQQLDTLPEHFGVEVGTTNGEVLLSMNNDAAPFDDPRVRLAVAHAIDREAVSEVVWEGLAVDTGGAPVPPTDPWFTGVNYAPHDPARARTLLREAGYDENNRPQVEFTVPSRPYAENISELVFSQLREVGFDITLSSSEFPAVWLNEVMGAADYQMSVIAHVEPRDIPTLFGDPTGYLRFDSPTVRELLTDADTAATPEQQTGLMIAAVEEIMAQLGSLTLVNMPNIVLTAPGVSGVDATVITDSIDLSTITKQDDTGEGDA